MSAVSAQELPEDRSSAVIFSYSRIGEDYAPETNLRTDQFLAQIDELSGGGYHVLSLPSLIDALDRGEILPPHSVVITFDGGYRSILEQAVPVLEARKLPFTIFFSSDMADNGDTDYLEWADLAKLSRNPLVTLGLHPAQYVRLSGFGDTEILKQLNRGKVAYRNHLDKEPLYFAYPFGEYDGRYKDLVKTNGFRAALTQQSGSAYGGSDFYALPRFTMTAAYGDIPHFRFVSTSLPLPASNITPGVTDTGEELPLIGFNVSKPLEEELPKLSCFVSGQSRPEIEVLGETRVEVRLSSPVRFERTRVNCTLPATSVDDEGSDEMNDIRARWLGFLLTPPRGESNAEDPTDLQTP
ncbi:MAG: polysaccharide deacetylase family protein [Alphaproteobacteria bacterium]|nr:polysaccharide deacetylase family protein [Alphaproteobacteria bacterium]